MVPKLILFVTIFCVTSTKSVNRLNKRAKCPDVSSMCFEMDMSWCHETTQTYFYLEDGTKCKGCTECIPAPPVIECPSVLCPLWDIPMDCGYPEFFVMYMEYAGRECRACDSFYCSQ